MSDTPSAEQLSAFVDNELDLAQQLAFEQRLAADAPWRARVEGLRALRQALRQHAEYHRAPESLRAQVLAMAGQAAQVQRPRRTQVVDRARARWQQWLAWRPLATSLAAAALVVVVAHTALQPSRDAALGDEVIASHVRATLGQRLVDVESSDHHTVKPWLSARLDFSPPVRDMAGSGSPLVGGRMDYVGGRPVAVLVYKHGAHWVDSYVWPASGPDETQALSSQRGFQLAHWRRDGMAHWVVSDLGADEFQALVNALVAPDKAP
jgi:anti-sigma factor RsiW